MTNEQLQTLATTITEQNKQLLSSQVELCKQLGELISKQNTEIIRNIALQVQVLETNIKKHIEQWC